MRVFAGLMAVLVLMPASASLSETLATHDPLALGAGLLASRTPFVGGLNPAHVEEALARLEGASKALALVNDRPRDLELAIDLLSVLDKPAVSTPPAAATLPDALDSLGPEVRDALDSLEPELRDALRQTLRAFQRLGSLVASSTAPATDAGVRSARLDLLSTIPALHAALAASDEPLEIDQPPALRISLGTTNDVVTKDYSFVIDKGGNDLYLNNAGGTGIGATPCAAPKSVAFLLDIAGDDRYVASRSCGVNGGAVAGVGMLIDLEGDDDYGRREPLALPDPGEPETLSVAVAAGPGRLVIGLPPDDLPALGSPLVGGIVVRVDHALAFAVVETDDAVGALAAARGLPGVRHAGVDGIVRTAGINDPHYGEQYGVAHVRAPEAWAYGRAGDAPPVCVIDSGVRASHEDLQGAIADGIDILRGDAIPEDENGHGTHVAGILAARAGNGVGIVGMTDAKLLVAKVLDANGGGMTSDVATAIRWCVDHGARVVSMSLTTPSDVPVLHEAVEDAWTRGALLVAATGNGGCYRCVGYPAAYPEVLGVGCTEIHAMPCTDASHGAGLAIAAPGVDILSLDASADNAYRLETGTSMSTPFVAGAAVLAWRHAPDLTADEVRAILLSTARDMDAPNCDATTGFGMLDAAAAVERALLAPPPALSELDECMVHGAGVNGGAIMGGLGLLLDLEGNDHYIGGHEGANGGGATGGAGALLDLDGDDVFEADARGANGGAFTGRGLLVDLAGDDRFLVGGEGSNGGSAAGSALLVDLGGNDQYLAGGNGVNGGGKLGSGVLVDAAGADTYEGTWFGVNGGGGLGGVGVLVELGGDDEYLAESIGTNGGGNVGLGVLVDAAGNDSYEAGDFGTNGGGAGGGAGALVDLAGNDAYAAGSTGVNGGSDLGSAGLLVDLAGDDRYKAGRGGANGASTLGVGLLVDASGRDEYEDEQGGTGTDARVVPKGRNGAQLDL